MSGENPALYCALTLIAMQGHQTKQRQKKHDEPGLHLNSICNIGFRIGWMGLDEGNLLVMGGCRTVHTYK